MMSTPRLSNPALLYPADLSANPTLETQVINLVNAAFLRSHVPYPERWDLSLLRFRTPTAVTETLGKEGILCVIYDTAVDGPHNGSGSGKVVACAAAIPWGGGWNGEGKGKEEGWEIKIVCVDGDAKYARTGLAVRVVGCLETHLVQRARQVSGGDESRSPDGDGIKNKTKASLQLWILAAECLNGVYWRKRGYVEVRRAVAGEGIWGCKTSFEMIVLKKNVKFQDHDNVPLK